MLNPRLKLHRFMGVAAMLAALSGCTSLLAPLVKPDVSAEISAVEAGDYVMDTAHASILFKIDHLGYSTYIGRFEAFEAKLSGDPANPGGASVEAAIDMTSLDIANDAFATELMGPDWFDAAAFPTASFVSTKVEMIGQAQAAITGNLTLHGVTRPVTLDATFNGGAYDRLRGADVVGFSATTTLNRSAFGVDKFSGLVTDEVTLEIEAEFLKQ